MSLKIIDKFFISLFIILFITVGNLFFLLAYRNDEIKLKIKSRYKLDIKPKESILIEFDTTPAKTLKTSGPYALNRAISQHLPYSVNNCQFVASDSISLLNTKNKTDYFFITLPELSENDYNEWVKRKQAHKLILGPNFVPVKKVGFPQKNNWKEGRLPEIIKEIGGIAVHTNEVRDFLINGTDTSTMLLKYLIVRSCTNLRPENVKSFKDRTIDILFFEKYADIDHSKQGAELFDLLNKSGKKIAHLKYGSYNKEQMMEYAQDSKFIIYFSFFDCGPVGLKEIQNYGVITFTLQKEFILDENTGYYIPELKNEDNIKAAYDIIMNKIDEISKEKPDTKLISEVNQDANRCDRALDDLCDALQINLN